MLRHLVSRLLPGACLAAALLAVAGCGGESVKLVPVEGVVKIGGKPVGNVLVQFMPDTRAGMKGPTSTAMTDEGGKFRLVAQDGRDGATVGKHMVVLVDADEDRPAQGKPAKKARLDSKYAAPTLSNLTAEVTESGTPIELNVPAAQ
jgi:hypothetical protein